MHGGYQVGLVSRPRRKRRLFWLIFGVGALLVVLVGGLFYALRNVAWFQVAKFDVTGTSLPADSVLSALKVAETGSGLRGLLGSANILFWQFGRQPDVSLSLPLVASLGIEPDLFARTVKVSATDRTLWGMVCESGGVTCYGVDQNGIVFAHVPQTEGVLILKVTDANDRALILGEPFLPSPSWLQNFMGVLNTLATSGYPVASIAIDDFTTHAWHATLASGQTMDFSLDFVPANFRSVLSELKTEINFAKTMDIDFSVPQRIYYK